MESCSLGFSYIFSASLEIIAIHALRNLEDRDNIIAHNIIPFYTQTHIYIYINKYISCCTVLLLSLVTLSSISHSLPSLFLSLLPSLISSIYLTLSGLNIFFFSELITDQRGQQEVWKIAHHTRRHGIIKSNNDYITLIVVTISNLECDLSKNLFHGLWERIFFFN